MRGRWVTAVVVGGVLALMVGAFVVMTMGARACSKVGCGSEATFDVSTLEPDVRDAASAVRLCLDGRCETTLNGHDNIDSAWSRLVSTTIDTGYLEVEDASGSIIGRYELAGPVEAERWYPNGEGCEPMCPQLHLVLVGGELQKAAA